MSCEFYVKYLENGEIPFSFFGIFVISASSTICAPSLRQIEGSAPYPSKIFKSGYPTNCWKLASADSAKWLVLPLCIMAEKEESNIRASGVVLVTMADFPVCDGSVPPDSFLRRCRRLAELGGIPDDKLGAVLAARCRGLALQLVESAGSRGEVETLLKETFGPKQPEAAAAQLSAVVKGSMSVLDYSLHIQKLVVEACPEFFDATGVFKKRCAPSHQAALCRHFLVGLSPTDKCFLSRQGVTSFDAAVRELTREERLARSCGDHQQPTGPTVSWASDNTSHTVLRILGNAETFLQHGPYGNHFLQLAILILKKISRQPISTLLKYLYIIFEFRSSGRLFFKICILVH